MPTTRPKTGQADNTTIPHNSTTPQALATHTFNSPTNQPAHHRNQNQPQPHQTNPDTPGTVPTTTTPQRNNKPKQSTSHPHQKHQSQNLPHTHNKPPRANDTGTTTQTNPENINPNATQKANRP